MWIHTKKKSDSLGQRREQIRAKLDWTSKSNHLEIALIVLLGVLTFQS